jgi:hypothetical protein
MVLQAEKMQKLRVKIPLLLELKLTLKILKQNMTHLILQFLLDIKLKQQKRSQ